MVGIDSEVPEALHSFRVVYWHGTLPFLDELLLVSCKVKPDSSQHIRELFPGEHTAAVLVHLSKARTEGLDLSKCQGG